MTKHQRLSSLPPSSITASFTKPSLIHWPRAIHSGQVIVFLTKNSTLRIPYLSTDACPSSGERSKVFTRQAIRIGMCRRWCLIFISKPKYFYSLRRLLSESRNNNGSNRCIPANRVKISAQRPYPRYLDMPRFHDGNPCNGARVTALQRGSKVVDSKLVRLEHDPCDPIFIG